MYARVKKWKISTRKKALQKRKLVTDYLYVAFAFLLRWLCVCYRPTYECQSTFCIEKWLEQNWLKIMKFRRCKFFIFYSSCLNIRKRTEFLGNLVNNFWFAKYSPMGVFNKTKKKMKSNCRKLIFSVDQWFGKIKRSQISFLFLYVNVT